MQSDSTPTRDDIAAWPPGTVTLEELKRTSTGSEEGYDIILVPTPSSDVNDPLNWKPWEKYLNFGLTLLYSLLVFALISAITPTWSPMNIELGFSFAALNNSYATGSATLAVGALIFIPFALKFGRRPIYLASLIGQIAVSIWAAKMTTVADLYLIQAFNCLLGALAEVIVQMTIADLFFVHQRGLMNALYVCAMSIGTAMAGLCAGYITVSQGWRWVWWWVAILLGVCLLCFTFGYEETKFGYKIEGISGTDRRGASTDAQKSDLDKKSFDEQLKPVQSATTNIATTERKPYLQRIKPITASSGSLKDLAHHVYQPLLVMFTIPAVLYVALLYGLVTAALQVSVTLIATYMPAPPYLFSPSAVGLMSLPIFIGNLVGTLIVAPITDRSILYLARKNKGIYEPEMRLYPLLVAAPLFSGGLIFFGFALGKGMDWPIVAVAAGIFSSAMTPILSMALSYLTDAYADIIGDAITGVTFTRNVLATVFVVSITPWTAQVPLQYVLVTFAMLCALFVGGGTVIMLLYGKRLRTASIRMYKVYARRQIDTRAI